LIRGVEAALMNALSRKSREVRDPGEPQPILSHTIDEESGGIVEERSSVGLKDDGVAEMKIRANARYSERQRRRC
jgi:hypothetical protein